MGMEQWNNDAYLCNIYKHHLQGGRGSLKAWILDSTIRNLNLLVSDDVSEGGGGGVIFKINTDSLYIFFGEMSI